MKKILIVMLDLSGTSSSHEALFEAIKKQGTWWHYMRSTWLIYTDKSPEQMVDALKPYVNGRMLVSVLNRPYQGLLPSNAWQWIRKRLKEE